MTENSTPTAELEAFADNNDSWHFGNDTFDPQSSDQPNWEILSSLVLIFVILLTLVSTLGGLIYLYQFTYLPNLPDSIITENRQSLRRRNTTM